MIKLCAICGIKFKPTKGARKTETRQLCWICRKLIAGYGREAMIEELIKDDILSITDRVSENGQEYIENILRKGFKGYNKYTNIELNKELQKRFDIYKIIKEPLM